MSADLLRQAIASVRAGGKPQNVRCPSHDDRRASLSVGRGDDGRVLLHCQATCSTETVLAAAGLTWADLGGETPTRRNGGSRQIVAEYRYLDEAGAHLFDVVRFEPKDFRQRRADGTWSLRGVRRVLYRLPALQDQHIAYVVEGEKDADRLVGLGLPATTSPGGAGKWRPEFTDQLKAAGVASVVVLPDHDPAGQAHAETVAGSCRAAGLQVRIVELPVPAKGDVSDWLAAGHTREELDALCARAPSVGPAPQFTLEACVATFRRWLYLDDPAPLYAVAAALVANRAPGDPVWLLLVCAPSTGKTEILSAAAGLPWVTLAAKVTEASLLSGSSQRERAKDATGGLLRQVGDFGVLLCKDFTSVLAQNKDARAEAMAALREVYDGDWHRPVGTDGGRVLTWRGKCGLLGGVTPALDQYGQVLSALGDRFVLLRMPDANVEDFGAAALRHGDQERAMRRDLQAALGGLVEHADTGRVNRPLADDERHRLIRLAAYTARTRTAVVRDGYRQDVLYLPQVEGPGRLVKAYARLLGGLEAIGCDDATAWGTLTRIAIDCAPALRTKVIGELLRHDGPVRTSDIAEGIETVTKTASRYLEDLSILKLADHSKQTSADNAPDLWAASKWLREHWPLKSIKNIEKSETEKYPPHHYAQVEGDRPPGTAVGGGVLLSPTFWAGGEPADRAPAATDKTGTVGVQTPREEGEQWEP